MNRYLTKKARATGPVKQAENAAAILLLLAASACLYVAFYGFVREGLTFAHLILCGVLALLAVLISPITERKRARMHAEVIVRTLMKTENGWLPFDELEKQSGVRRAADTALTLQERGYLQHIVQRRGVVGFEDRMPQETADAEAIKPIFAN